MVAVIVRCPATVAAGLSPVPLVVPIVPVSTSFSPGAFRRMTMFS